MDFLKPLSRFRGDICIDTIYIVFEIVCITFMMTKSNQCSYQIIYGTFLNSLDHGR